jgi:hypothetical protein
MDLRGSNASGAGSDLLDRGVTGFLGCYSHSAYMRIDTPIGEKVGSNAETG